MLPHNKQEDDESKKRNKEENCQLKLAKKTEKYININEICFLYLKEVKRKM